MFAKVKNLVTLAPVLGAILRPEMLSPSVAEIIYSFHLDGNKDFGRKVKLKNDLLPANELSSLPPEFHLITGKLANEHVSYEQNFKELHLECMILIIINYLYSASILAVQRRLTRIS